LEAWSTENSKVYSHAILNIAATGASDSSKGLFFSRRANTRMQEIRLDWSVKEKASVRPTILDYEYWKHLVEDEPLIRRAWVVQERLLAQRVLHFGSNQLFWECSQKDASEDLPEDMPLILITSGQQNGFKFAAVTAERPIESGHPTPAHAVG
jgi:hypothetical protein